MPKNDLGKFNEAFGRDFVSMFNEFSPVPEHVVPTSVDEAWREIGDGLRGATQAFKDKLDALNQGGAWEGKTIQAAFDNAMQSTDEPFYTGTAALRGAELVHKFRDTFQYVNEHLVQDIDGTFPTLYDRYLDDKSEKTETRSAGRGGVYQVTTTPDVKQVEEDYNSWMRSIMNGSYVPGLKDVQGGYPQFVVDKTAKPETPPQIPGVNLDSPGSSPPSVSSGGGTPSFTTPGTSSLPTRPESSLAQFTGAENLGQQQQAPQGASDALSAATEAAKSGLSGASDAANQAMSGATNAATQAAGALQGLAGKKPGLPEGVLSLGKGATGSGGSSLGTGKSGGGGGAGSARMGSDLPPSRPAAQTASANSSGTNATTASKSGIGSSSPGAGAPAAGSRGAGSDGKEHKVSKALRTRRNGTDIAGEAEAVVAVVGDDEVDKSQAPRQ